MAMNHWEEGSSHGASGGDIISVAEASSLLGVHRNTVYRLIHEGELPAFKLVPGGRWRFRRQEINHWIDDKQGRGVR